MVLLICSVLLIRSFAELRSTPPGFSPRHVLTMEIQLPPARYPRPANKIAFYSELLRRVDTLPGIDAAALSTALPVSATHFTPALFEGQPVVPLGQRTLVNLLQSSPAYSKVMRIPLITGRLFTAHDNAESPKVAIVNQVAVKKFWPDSNPVGKHVWIGRIPEPFEVVGVLADTRNNGLSAATMPELLLPLPQMPAPNLSLSVPTPVDPQSLVSAVRGAVAAIDPDQPVTSIRTMEEVIDSLNAQPRFTMQLAGALAAVAFILAITGLYGVIAYSVAQRTRELGVRIALGAGYGSILRLVVGQGLTIAIIDTLIGVAAALGRRAARVDPVESLRAE